MIHSHAKTNEQWLIDARKVHGDKYRYPKVYVNQDAPLTIVCQEHGEFKQNPRIHLRGAGCPDCRKHRKWSTKRLTNKQFLEKAKMRHNNKYAYASKYTISKAYITIICPVHGVFEQTATSHLNGAGCPKCRADKMFMGTDKFIEKAQFIHGDKWNYSLVDYKSSYIKIKIICRDHGIFEQVPYSHLWGNGCPTCHESYGEQKIHIWLEDNNIKFTPQKTFDSFRSARNNRKFSFDFFVPELDILIEYQGIQHYKSFKHFGGIERLAFIKNNDIIKKKWAKKNNYKLIVIKYTQFDKISKTLEKSVL